MANKKITELTELNATPATNDVVPIVDVSDTTDAATGTTKKITTANLFSSPTITTPTIADFTNAQHDHTDADDGGQLTDAALSSAVGIAKGGTGQTTATAAFDALAPTTTQGDIIYHNGTDNVRLAKGTAGQVLKMNDGATAPEWGNTTPFFQQSIPIPDYGGTGQTACGSNQSGSVMFFCNAATTELNRFERDSNSGMYFLTHTANVTSPINGGDYGAIIMIGGYIYLFRNNGTNITCVRYLASDLTGEQEMTVPTVGCTANVTAWTDGTYAYVVSNSSDTTARKWSVSGTTFTAVSTATLPASSTYAESQMASMYDGTSAYLVRFNASNDLFNIYKFTNIDGSSVSSSSKIIKDFSDQDKDIFLANIGPSLMYVGTSSLEYDEAAGVTRRINLIPITKP